MREPTYYQIQEKIEPFELEKLVTIILFNVDRDPTISYKFSNIRKIGGIKDNGQDAISIFHQENKYLKTIYAISKRKDFKRKIEEDLKKASQSKNVTKFVFISTEDVGKYKDPEYMQRLREKYNVETEVFDINDLVNWLDSTSWGKNVKQNFGIGNLQYSEVISRMHLERHKSLIERNKISIENLSFNKFKELCQKQNSIEISSIGKKYIKEIFVNRENLENDFLEFLSFLQDTKKYNESIKIQNKQIKKENDLIIKQNEKVIAKNSNIAEEQLRGQGLLKNVKKYSKEKEIKNCLLILGEAGVGKTNSICYLVEKYSQKYPTIFLNGSKILLSTNKSIENVIIENYNKLGLQVNNSIIPIVELADKNEKHLLIFFDAINECLSPEFMKIYLKEILNYFRDKNIAFIISCRDTDWRSFENEDAIDQCIFKKEKILDFNDNETSKFFIKNKNPLKIEKPFLLTHLTDKEFEKAWDFYKKYFNLKGEITNDIKNICKHPIMLRFFCEAYQNELVPPKDIKRIELFDRYWEKKLISTGEKRDAQTFIFKLIEEMIRNKKTEILEKNIENLTKQTTDKELSIFSKLLSENIIIFRGIDKMSMESKIGFTYEAFFEYAIARFILNHWTEIKEKQIIKGFKNLIENIPTFRNFMGTIEYIILHLEKQKFDIYKEMIKLLIEDYDIKIKCLGIKIIGKIENISFFINDLFQLMKSSNFDIHGEILNIVHNYPEKLSEEDRVTFLNNLLYISAGNSAWSYTK